MENLKRIKKSKAMTVVVSVAMILTALGFLFMCIGCKPIIGRDSTTYGGAGDTITINGQFFGTSGSIKIANGKGQSVTIPSGDCQWTDTEITFQIPSNLDWQPSDPGGGRLTVTNSEGSGGKPFTFIVGDVLPLDITIGYSATGATYVAQYSTDDCSSWIPLGTIPPNQTRTWRMNVPVGPDYQIPIVRVYCYSSPTGYQVSAELTGSAVFGYARVCTHMLWCRLPYGGTGTQKARLQSSEFPIPDGYFKDVQVVPQ